ncbi:MAG: nucleoside recognition domain-containing protein [Clostridia bacterium]
MLNIVWVLLLIIGFIAGIINGRINEIAQSIMTSADDAVKFAIGLLGIVALWCGIIQILEDAGGVRAASKVLRPLITKLFPGTAGNEKAQSSIITNITANFFGLGNGATPSGIEAVNEMKHNLKDVCLFLVINSAGLQLIPSTVIAMRSELGASNPADILLPTWIVSLISMASALIIYFIYRKIYYSMQAKKRN